MPRRVLGKISHVQHLRDRSCWEIDSYDVEHSQGLEIRQT